MHAQQCELPNPSSQPLVVSFLYTCCYGNCIHFGNHPKGGAKADQNKLFFFEWVGSLKFPEGGGEGTKLPPNFKAALGYHYPNAIVTASFPPVIYQNKNSEFCAPLTSFDWNETDPNILGASSIDTTCTIWGLEVCVCVCLEVWPVSHVIYPPSTLFHILALFLGYKLFVCGVA